MRVAILSGILGAVCLFGAHDWWELRAAQGEERQAMVLSVMLDKEFELRSWNKPALTGEIVGIWADGTIVTQLAPNKIMFTNMPPLYPQSWFLPDGSCPKCEEYKAKK